MPAWYIDQIASTNTFYTSPEPQRSVRRCKHVVGHRATHDGFWRPEVDDGVAVFHRKETTKAHAQASRVPATFWDHCPEANDLLDRRCYRALRNLADQQEIHAVEHRNTTVYVHSWPSLRDAQLSQRETDQPTDVSPVDTDEEGYLYRDELLATFLSVAVSEIQSIPPERAAALVLRQFEGDSFDALERRLRRNHPSGRLSTTSQRTSRTGRRSGVPSTTFTPMNSVTASSRCVATYSLITITPVSSS